MENKKLILKSVIYRLYSSLVAFAIAFVVTGNVAISASIGVVDIFVKVFTYFIFDIVWKKITSKKYKVSVIWLTGLSGAGKTTISTKIFEKLKKEGVSVMTLDGDEIRGIFKTTGFDKKSRDMHVLSVGKMASFLQSKGVIAVVSLISPYRDIRNECRRMSNNFVEVFVDTPIDVCEERDVKGLYKKARAGEIKDFTGIDSPYEEPDSPEVIIDTLADNPDRCAEKILKLIRE